MKGTNYEVCIYIQIKNLIKKLDSHISISYRNTLELRLMRLNKHFLFIISNE